MMGTKKSKVIFISGNTDSASHRFRVLHAANFITKSNFLVDIFDADQYIDKASFSDCIAVIIFRAEWNNNLNHIIQFCRKKKIPLCFDIDDLIFDQKILDNGYWAYFMDLPTEDKIFWKNKVLGYQKTMQQCDVASVSTPYLVEAAKSFCNQAYLLPNTLDENMLQLALQATLQIKPSKEDHKIRIGFASGTPTHAKDFKVVVSSLRRILMEYKNVILTIVGNLNMSDYPELKEFEDQTEVRPLVSMDELFKEIYRFDINIAPLEVPNPFCESKSPLRLLFAGAVKIPTVVSPTQPLIDAAGYGTCGLIAHHENEWYEALRFLIENPAFRQELGISAERNTLAHFGPETGRTQTLKILEDISARNEKKENNSIQKLLHVIGNILKKRNA